MTPPSPVPSMWLPWLLSVSLCMVYTYVCMPVCVYECICVEVGRWCWLSSSIALTLSEAQSPSEPRAPWSELVSLVLEWRVTRAACALYQTRKHASCPLPSLQLELCVALICVSFITNKSDYHLCLLTTDILWWDVCSAFWMGLSLKLLLSD